MTLHVYSTRYSRGAVVKLAESLSEQPLVKFVIERNKGACAVREVTGFEFLIIPPSHGTEEQFIEYAERECERIRTVLGASDGGR